MEWKWTKGESYEKSKRLYNGNQQEKQNENTADPYFIKEFEHEAYTSSLHHDENTWDILNQQLSGSGFKVSNKREELDSKIADREMIQQIGYNSFLSQNDYVNDVTISDKFLKPISTSQDRLKAENE